MAKKNNGKKRLVAAVAYSLVYGVADAAIAGPAGLEEVIVTAQKHEENIQVIPLAITAVTNEEMQKQGITSFEGIAKNSPNLTITPYPSSSNTLVLTMRGQGYSDPGQITSDGAVGLYEDGF